MGWLSWLSKEPKVVNDVFDKDNGLLTQAGNWIGNMNLTEEEVMEANAKIVTSVQDHVKDTLSENTERSKSRRSIADKVVSCYLIWFSVACGVWPLNSEYAQFLLGILSGLAIGGAFMAVIIFHFGNYGLMKSAVKNK